MGATLACTLDCFSQFVHIVKVRSSISAHLLGMSMMSLHMLSPEILLHVLSYLDPEDLYTLSRTSHLLSTLSRDPILNRQRILVVVPSRISHSLFATNENGVPLRPTVGDLVHRGVMRGHAIERRWRMGIYIYSSHVSYNVSLNCSLDRRFAVHQAV